MYYCVICHMIGPTDLLHLLQHRISKLSSYWWYHTFEKCMYVTCVRILILKQLISTFSFRLESDNQWTIRDILVKFWIDTERKCTPISCKNNPLTCHDSLTSIMLGYEINDRRFVIRFPTRTRLVLSPKGFRLALEPTQHPLPPLNFTDHHFPMDKTVGACWGWVWVQIYEYLLSRVISRGLELHESLVVTTDLYHTV
jgi:hypothetical protein